MKIYVHKDNSNQIASCFDYDMRTRSDRRKDKKKRRFVVNSYPSEEYYWDYFNNEIIFKKDNLKSKFI